MAQTNVFGYDTFMICEGSLRNIESKGRVIGFAVDLRIANYRGYILSQVEDLHISVDGRVVPRDDLRFTIDGRSYTLEQMETTIDDRWEWLQTATLSCAWPGGLTPGAHDLTVEEHIRASYLPFTAVSIASKTLTLGAPCQDSVLMGTA